MRLTAGTRLGPYQIVAPLGAGGMGEVYRALDTRLDREVAVKILPEATTADPRARARFEREAKTVAALSHPNILSIHDIHLDGEVPYAVMELLEGETLAQRIARGTLHWKEAVTLASAMAEGLAAAHAKGVVHRDLKPSNVFLTVDGRLKILDFGLARTARSEAGKAETEADTVSATEPGTVMGTVGYMSPEQIRGLPAEATSDIFSFGCVLYEMVAGKRPFGGATAPEAMAAILRDTAQPLAEGPRVVPEELDRLVAHCLEKHPEQRFQSARDLLYALRSLQTGPSAAVTVPEAKVPEERRGRGLLVAAAAVVIVAVAALLLAFVPRLRPWSRTPSIRSVAVLPLANLSGDPEQEYFADGMTDELITDLSKIPSIRVISRPSVMRFKGTKEPLPAIAKLLGVDAVVVGSVRRSGQQVRIAAQLVEAAADRNVWAESFDRDLKDVFQLQSDVAKAISKEVGGRLSTAEEARLAPKKPVPPEAYEAYLKGRFYHERLGPEDLEKARDYFEKAITLAPDFAPAHVWLGYYYETLGWEGVIPPKVAFPKAEATLMKALELEPDSPDAHRTLGVVYYLYHWNFEAAEREERAATASADLGENSRYARYEGRFQTAIDAAKRTLGRNPLGLGAHLNLGTAYAWARRYDEAIDVYRKGVEIQPDSSQAHELLADAYAHKGSHREAVEELKKALELSHFDDWAKELEQDFASLGWEKAFRNLNRKRLDEKTALAKEGTYVSPVDFAALHSMLGEKDEAFRWLERALEERSPALVALRADPLWDPLRGDPRLGALASRVTPGR